MKFKYISKVIWFVIAVIFIASLIIGLGVIFAVKNVNVSLESYTFGEWEEMDDEQRTQAERLIGEFKSDILEKYRGKLMGTVSPEKLAECFYGTDYVLEGFEKKYPCTLNITLRERRETFAVAVTQGYNVYDGEGEFLRVKSGLENNIDGAFNIIAEADAQYIKDIAELSGYFAQDFSALRSAVERISVDRTDSGNMIFKLRCGLNIRIVDYKNLSREKIRAAYTAFGKLSGGDKMSGTIIANSSSGFAVAEYFPA